MYDEDTVVLHIQRAPTFYEHIFNITDGMTELLALKQSSSEMRETDVSG